MAQGPLSILKLSTVSTAVPLLAEQPAARFRINSFTLDQPEGNRTWVQIKADCRTIDPVASSEGQTINPGFPVFVTFPLGTKDDPSTPPEWAGPAIAKFIDGVLGTSDEGNKKGKPTRPDLQPEDFPQFIGKEFFAKIAIKPGKDDYPANNVLKNFVFPGDIVA